MSRWLFTSRQVPSRRPDGCCSFRECLLPRASQVGSGGVGVRVEIQPVKNVFPASVLETRITPLYVSLAHAGSHDQDLLKRRLGRGITDLSSLEWEVGQGVGNRQALPQHSPQQGVFSSFKTVL